MDLRLRSNEARRPFARKPSGRRVFCPWPALTRSLQPAAGRCAQPLVANGSKWVQSPVGAACSVLMALLRSFGFFAVRFYKYFTPTELWFFGGSVSIRTLRWGRERRPLREAGDDWDGFPGTWRLTNFRCPCRTFLEAWLDRVVAGEGVIKCITVIHLILASSVTTDG